MKLRNSKQYTEPNRVVKGPLRKVHASGWGHVLDRDVFCCICRKNVPRYTTYKLPCSDTDVFMCETHKNKNTKVKNAKTMLNVI